MKTSAWVAGLSLAGLLASSFFGLAAQSGPNPADTNAAGFTNLDFELGTPGDPPPGWSVPKAQAAEGFSAILTTNQPNHGKQCAEIRWPGDRTPPASRFANLMRSVDATPWRNKRIKVTAAIRVASAENGQRAQMWLRVDCPGGLGAFDNMNDRPVRQQTWADYAITADVAEDAQKLHLGLMTLNGATAWWDHVRIEVLGEISSGDLNVLAGNWKGALEVGPMPLRVFFVFERDATNRLRGYFVSPDQNETRLPLTRMTLSSNSVAFAVSSIGGTYTGQLDRASRELKGTWKQGNWASPLVLAFTETDWKRRRPQTPKPPFPYQSEDVTFENVKAQVKLAGTLTRPDGRGPFPALVLISGSGPQDRDETLFGHKLFAAESDFGMARIQSAWMQFMLRYDPAADFQRVKCPVLALNGQLDTQILAAQNLPAIEKNLKASGNTRGTAKEIKSLNHLFQTAQTGDLKEYGEIEESFSPFALSEILTWLKVNAKTSDEEPNGGVRD